MQPQFKIGELVKHKISKNKYVIIKIFPKKWYRKYAYYDCSIGDDDLDYITNYESELKKA